MVAAITPRDEIRRVLIAGDAHGNAAWVETLTTKAAERACPVIFQVGDFEPVEPTSAEHAVEVES